jgi:hypothetical protein
MCLILIVQPHVCTETMNISIPVTFAVHIYISSLSLCTRFLVVPTWMVFAMSWVRGDDGQLRRLLQLYKSEDTWFGFWPDYLLAEISWIFSRYAEQLESRVKHAINASLKSSPFNIAFASHCLLNKVCTSNSLVKCNLWFRWDWNMWI